MRAAVSIIARAKIIVAAPPSNKSRPRLVAAATIRINTIYVHNLASSPGHTHFSACNIEKWVWPGDEAIHNIRRRARPLNYNVTACARARTKLIM